MRQRVRSHGAKSTFDNNHLRLLLDPVDGKQFVVTIGAAMQYDEESRPNFAAPIYPAPSGRGITVPADAPPLFLLAANDDPMGAGASLPLYSAWRDAGHPVELHIYAQGGHGFGMKKQGLPTDHWIDRFGDWLQSQGFLA